jgi:multisubunit Na+/H+ antiporter MnhG subunit
MNGIKILSIALLIIGALLLLVGILFKVFHFPDLFQGNISGPIIIVVGVAAFLLSKNKK